MPICSQEQLAGHPIRDQHIETTRAKLEALSHDCDRLVEKLESHNQLCEKVNSKQVSTSDNVLVHVCIDQTVRARNR